MACSLTSDITDARSRASTPAWVVKPYDAWGISIKRDSREMQPDVRDSSLQLEARYKKRAAGHHTPGSREAGRARKHHDLGATRKPVKQFVREACWPVICTFIEGNTAVSEAHMRPTSANVGRALPRPTSLLLQTYRGKRLHRSRARLRPPFLQRVNTEAHRMNYALLTSCTVL